MKNNVLSLVLLTALTLSAPLHGAAAAAQKDTPAVATSKSITCRPKRPAKKRVKKSWLAKKVAGVKLLLKVGKRSAKKNWVKFAKENPGKATALKALMYSGAAVLVVGGTYLVLNRNNKDA